MTDQELQQEINVWRNAVIAVLPRFEPVPCPGCGDLDCDFDCDGEYDEAH